ncbi:MAG: glutamate 5-kinase [Tannerellaceae bacterium]|nr:glutamate 5-kinase [Tannerellaceae bacterium]
MNRIVVKIGSNVLTRGDGTLDVTRISALTDQIAILWRSGVQVVVVSSGAVASGRGELAGRVLKLDPVSERQLFSAVGQIKLIDRYYNLFREHGIACGQVLTTRTSLSTRRDYLNQKNCMDVMLSCGVVPIVNENDTISVTELMFTDNDELSGMVSTMMSADALIILSNIDGIFTGNPADPSSELIREITPDGGDLSGYIQRTHSSFGRGGMLTKSRIARQVAAEGIEVIIANGKREGILTEIVLKRGESEVPFTRFVPSAHPVSGVKKWIAHSGGFAKGEIHINARAVEALCGTTAVSLLSVGVERVEGEFEKGDIVKVFAPEGMQIGVGRVSTDSTHARRNIGVKGSGTLVHYDYLYLY